LRIGYYDPVLPTKLHHDFIQAEKRDQKIRIRLGVLEGKLLQPPQLSAVASLPARGVLLAMLLSGLQGPIRGLVFALSGLLRGLVGVISAIQERKKGEGEMPTTEGQLWPYELLT